MAPPVILIDGSSYLFRAFHALPPLSTSKGQATGAIYGVANMVKRLIKDFNPQKIAVIFDTKGKTFRETLYPAYKAHRPPMPDELRSQFEPLCALLKAMGLPVLMIEGVEADDVIGTFARIATEQQQNVLISTGDKDMAQLVNDHITLINTMTNQILDVQGVKNKFGVWPHQIIDYLALMGDSVDNVPGVSQCGPKTAVKWLETYGSLDNIISQHETIKGKIGEKLKEALDFLPLAKQLVTIKTDVMLEWALDELVLMPPHESELIAWVQTLEFNAWLKTLLSEKKTVKPVRDNVPALDTVTAIEAFVEAAVKTDKLYIMVQTTTGSAMTADLLGVGLQCDDNPPVYIPLLSPDTLGVLKPLFENPSVTKIGYDFKSVYTLLTRQGILLKGSLWDVMLESYVLDSVATQHNLSALSLKYVGYEANDSDAARRVIEQVGIVRTLHNTLYPKLIPSLLSVFTDIEMPLLSVLSQMEQAGILIDATLLQQHGQRLKTRLQSLEDAAFKEAGRVFNLSSPKQLQDILFVEKQLPVLVKTPKGQPSTAESVLVELATAHALPAIILEHRGLSKLLTTYIDALPKCINATTGRVHTQYNQAITATGRLSSSEPNLQNIPIRSEEGRLIRTAFIAKPGYVLMSADYSQIELRIMAHLSQDAALVEAFQQDLDVHTATASEIFQIPRALVTAEQRRRAKAVNFGLIYGMSAFGLAKQLNISRKDAEHYLTMYFERYPAVLTYMERTRQFAHDHGFVETIFGRRLYLPEINAKNFMRQQAAERMAINAPMQGSAADIIKKAMLAVAEWQKTASSMDVHMLLQVHDELLFEVKVDKVDVFKPILLDLMENSTKISVPLKVSIGTGPHWDAAH